MAAVGHGYKSNTAPGLSTGGIGSEVVLDWLWRQ